MQCAACAAAGTTLASLSAAAVSGQSSPGTGEVMSECPYGAVQLTGGPLKHHFDRIHAHFRTIRTTARRRRRGITTGSGRAAGTLVQGVADYVLNAYFHDADALLVNLFVPSELTWQRPGGTVAAVP